MPLSIKLLKVFRYGGSNIVSRAFNNTLYPFKAQSRTKLWLNPLRKTNKNHSSNKVTIEEPNRSKILSKEEQKIDEINHYLRTSDLENEEKKKILAVKLRELVKEVADFSVNSRIMPTINSIMKQLENLGKDTGNTELTSRDDLIELFEKSFLTVKASNFKNVPEYVVKIASSLAEDSQTLSPRIEVILIELAKHISKGNLEASLRLFIRSKKLNNEFVDEFFRYHGANNTLNIKLFSSFTSAALESGSSHLICDEYFKFLFGYIERTFENSVPKVHEYKDLEKSTLRIQKVINNALVSANLRDLSLEVYLKLISLLNDLNTLNKDDQSLSNIDRVLQSLVHNESSDDFSALKSILHKGSGDEDLIISLFSVLWSRPQFQTLTGSLTKYIVENEINLSPGLMFQCRVYDRFTELDPINEKELVDEVVDLLAEHMSTETASDIHDSVLQVALSVKNFSPNGYFVNTLSKYFSENFHIEDSVFSFKYRIDKAIELKDVSTAILLFEESLSKYVPWSQYTDISLHSTLNQLIVLLCNSFERVDDIFPLFKKIKQQMVNTQCGTDAIISLARKMLAAEYVGDTIEMLKRELPSIKKDAVRKLPTNSEFAEKYRCLFNLLHDFVITYENEKTFETNWVLYGELHKYFDVPFESYLPAIKFFCEIKRHNAALLIFRQIKKLNELHGDHSHLPPSREIYMYLLQEFGDKLYQEGVEEIHEYLKMDVSIPGQDIDLQNCVLEAYCNLQDVPKANDLFLAMSTDFKETGGINEKTVEIMIKVYTYSDMIYVYKFWNNLSKYGIIPNYSIYRQYLIAHVYNGLIEEAIQLTDEMKDYDIEMSRDILSAMHNFCLETTHQKKIAEWASDKYKEEWEQLLESDALRIASDYVPDGNLLIES